MKRLFGIFSLSVLLFSTFAPAFTYATEAEEKAKEILNDTLEETMNGFENSDLTSNLQLGEENYLTLGLNENRVIFNPNGGAFSGMEENENKEYIYYYSGEELLPIYNIQIPDRLSNDMSQQSGWMFAGWYTTATNQAIEFDPTTSTTNIAYAKWLPFNDLSIRMSGVEFTLMDRNMGASDYSEGYSYNNYQSTSSYKKGYQYQWGNNYGFSNGTLSKQTNIQINLNDTYGPNNYYYNGLYVHSNSNWSNTIQGNMWGGENAEENSDLNRKGPCPKGYHIPTLMEWNKVLELYSGWSNTTEGQNYCNSLNNTGDQYCLTAKLKLPFAGYRGYYGSTGVTPGKYGYYWSSTYNTSSSAYYLIFDNEKIKTSSISFQFGSSLRCFKDDNYKNINLITNGGNSINKNYKTPRRWENAEILPTSETITREYSILKGWYTTENYNENTQVETTNINTNDDEITLYAKWECESGTILSEDGQSCNPNIGILNSNDGNLNERNIERYVTNNPFINNGYEFIGWNTQSDGLGTEYISGDLINQSGLVLYAQWKSLEEKSEENTNNNVTYTNNTTVTVGDETTEEVLSGSSTLKLVTEEVKEQEVTAEEDKTTVKESEIKVTSDKKVEYEGGLEVYLEKTENVGMANETTGKVEGTIKFSAPIAVKIPISSEAEYVKVQVKHEGEDFGFKGLTLNPVNECNNGEAINDKYNGEDVEVKENNGERYATIYTCSASTFVAYTESIKPVEPKPSAGGGRVIKQESNATEQEHNSADLEKDNVSTETNKSTVTTTRSNETVEQKVKKVEGKALTRGEVAVMTNILLEVFPQLIEGNKGLDDVTKACTSYTDEKDFTKEEKKAITRLCKLSIMGIHAEDKTALEEFMVSKESTNNEFNVVVNRAIENYNEKDLATVREALKKLEGDNEGVVFGTVYDVFMGIKSIFN